MSTIVQSISPIDGEPVWQGQAAGAEEIARVMEAASVAQESWSRRPVSERIEVARRYGDHLKENREAISQLLIREVGKLAWDAQAEVAASIAKVELSIQALQQRGSMQVIGESLESIGSGDVASVRVVRRVQHQPLGVVLVLGPFNFPLHLPGGQIIPSLLAGNAVVFKPSEQATAIGLWMQEAWRQSGLPEGLLQVIPGGVATATVAIDSPVVGGVFLTGSREAGHAIHRQLAGRFQVVLALELGGNNPIVVLPDASAESVASIVSFASFVSSGQRCTCARRVVLVSGPRTEQQLERLVQQTAALRVGMPGSEPPPHLGPMISPAAARRLHQTYDDLIALGCEPLIPFQAGPRHDHLVRPSILDASLLSRQASEKLGELEWFGPMLVIQRAASFQEACEIAGRTPYGLAAAMLGGTRDQFELFAAQVRAGVVNWNTSTTGAAGNLPFGGLGDSGNHRPAGFYAIDFCCDPIACLERESLVEQDPWMVTQSVA